MGGAIKRPLKGALVAAKVYLALIQVLHNNAIHLMRYLKIEWMLLEIEVIICNISRT